MGGAPHALPRRDGCSKKKGRHQPCPQGETKKSAPRDAQPPWDQHLARFQHHRDDAGRASEPTKNGQSGRPTQPDSAMNLIKRHQSASCVRTSRALWSGKCHAHRRILSRSDVCSSDLIKVATTGAHPEDRIATGLSPSLALFICRIPTDLYSALGAWRHTSAKLQFDRHLSRHRRF